MGRVRGQQGARQHHPGPHHQRRGDGPRQGTRPRAPAPEHRQRDVRGVPGRGRGPLLGSLRGGGRCRRLGGIDPLVAGREVLHGHTEGACQLLEGFASRQMRGVMHDMLHRADGNPRPPGQDGVPAIDLLGDQPQEPSSESENRWFASLHRLPSCVRCWCRLGVFWDWLSLRRGAGAAHLALARGSPLACRQCTARPRPVASAAPLPVPLLLLLTTSFLVGKMGREGARKPPTI
jgi:hypothetical protein